LTAATTSIGRVARRMTQFSPNSWNLSDDRSDLPQGSRPSAIYASCKLRHAVTNDKLVGWHYQVVELNEETLIAAAEVADWQMNR
jgi:hypothetical protein